MLCKNLQPIEKFYIRNERKMKTGLTARNVALMAIFAALYYILSLIAPISIPTGVGNLDISFAALFAAVIGLVLGPYLGTASAFLGAFVAWVLPPSGGNFFGLPFLLSPTLNALVTGLIFYKKWKFGFAIFGTLIVAFLLTPPIWPVTENWLPAVAVLFDKVIALLLIIPVALFARKLSVARASLFYFLLFFIGNQADNMWGSFIFATPAVYGLFGYDVGAVRLAFLASPFLYPAVRLVQALIGMLIAVPLMQTLKGTNWLWQRENILSLGKDKQAEFHMSPQTQST
jgi:ECF transporter S component (folate family)